MQAGVGCVVVYCTLCGCGSCSWKRLVSGQSTTSNIYNNSLRVNGIVLSATFELLYLSACVAGSWHVSCLVMCLLLSVGCRWVRMLCQLGLN